MVDSAVGVDDGAGVVVCDGVGEGVRVRLRNERVSDALTVCNPNILRSITPSKVMAGIITMRGR